MSRLVTHAEIANVPDGGVYYIDDAAELTPLAEERARARGVEIRRGAASHDAPPWLTEVTRQVLDRLGPVLPDAPEVIDQVVSEVVATTGLSGGAGLQAPEALGMPPSADYCATFIEKERRRARRRAVVTATGRNQKGIVARLTTVIAELDGDVLDISQTLVGDYFSMLVIVDTSELSTTFEQFKAALTQTAAELGAQTIVMHEDLVTSMHRV